MTDESLIEIFKALGHPLRLKICRGLSEKGECHVNKMVERLGVPQATVSNQLAILRKAGLVCQERTGTSVCYTISNELPSEIMILINANKKTRLM